MDQLVDAFGRPLRDLRISVTDRCNFRCTYCMPKEVFGHNYRFLDRKELLDFEEITRVAQAAGLPVKVNCVVKRGVNEDQVVELARYFRGSGHILRFIEFMDVGATNGWRMDDVVSAAEIVERVNAAFPIEPADANYRGEV